MRFVVVMPWGRVGSNLVVASLARVPGLEVANEPLTAIRTRMNQGELDVVQADCEQTGTVQDFVAGSSTAGLKVSHRSLLSPAAVYKELARVDRAVVMIRKNFLKCAVSLERADSRARDLQRKGEGGRWAVRSDEKKPGAATVDVARVLRLTKQFETFHEECLSYAQYYFQRSRLEVVYEELQSNPAAAIASVFDYLDLGGQEVHVVHRKATSDQLADDVLNYDELAAALESTPYARFLERDD